MFGKLKMLLYLATKLRDMKIYRATFLNRQLNTKNRIKIKALNFIQANKLANNYNTENKILLKIIEIQDA